MNSAITSNQQIHDHRIHSPQKRPVRVCHVSMCLSTGGLERLLVEFARRVDRERFELQFVALGEIGGPAAEIRELGLQVTQIARTEKQSRWRHFLALRNHFQEQRIDIVHTHNTYAHFYSALAARTAAVPTILNTQHGRGCGSGWKQRLHFCLANRFTQQILAVSEDSARICRRQDWLSRGKIEALWNGIDLKRFSFHGPASTSTAISVARLSPEKDFPTLLRATRLVVDQCPDFQLKIVGEGPERTRIERTIIELSLENHVTLLGERRDIPELLKDAGFFVSATTTEGISLTLLEAMAVGLPIITTNVGGNPEVVNVAETGYLVPPHDARQLAAVMSLHLQERDTWLAMGQIARSRVEQQFQIDRMISDYQALYRSYTTSSK